MQSSSTGRNKDKYSNPTKCPARRILEDEAIMRTERALVFKDRKKVGLDTNRCRLSTQTQTQT